MQRNIVYTGECVEIMQSWPVDCIDLTVTSPPYDDLRDYKGYAFDAAAILEQLHRITRPGGICVWVVGDKIKNGNRSLSSFKQALEAQKIGWLVHDVMIYEKHVTITHRPKAYWPLAEFMMIFCKPGGEITHNPIMRKTKAPGPHKARTERTKSGELISQPCTYGDETKLGNIWRYSVGSNCSTLDKIANKHPAIFPEKLAQDHIHSWSNPGDLVLDPMCGSGTTCKMAKLQRRDYIGIDIAPEYTAIAKERLCDLPQPLAI